MKLPLSRICMAGRNATGNTLALVAAVTASVLIVILLFALSYTRLIGGSQEQKTAIEAASIAAAKDIGRIVINDSNFGYIGLSDAAPVGGATAAADGFSMPVYGLNTMVGTLRLDLIIADKTNNATMKYFCKQDLVNLKSAKDKLVAVLQAAILPGGSGKDIDGGLVEPYASAEKAYEDNKVRMTGESRYVKGSLKLTLGCLSQGVQTNIPLPKPNSWALVDSTNQSRSGFYVSEINCPYDGEDFVFGSISNNIKLVNTQQFQTTGAGLPYTIPSVIKAEADQMYEKNRVVRLSAAATAASVFDPKPAPGTLSIAFPDGRPPFIGTPYDILNSPALSGAPVMTIRTPATDDFPNPGGTAMTPGSWTGPGSSTIKNVFSQSFYDWLRLSGTKLNAQDAVDLFTNPLLSAGAAGPFTTGYMDIYRVDQSGAITQKLVLIDPDPFEAVSHKQMYAESKSAATTTAGKKSSPADWDVYIRDQVTQLGTINGGKHGGRPLSNPLVALSPGSSFKTICHKNANNLIATGADKFNFKLGNIGGFGDGASSGGSANASSSGGLPPACFGPRDDFGGATTPGPSIVSFPSGTGMPGTYLQNGSAVSIRFRVAAQNDASGQKLTKKKKN
ncbi:MAG: hypothetical protein DKT66_14615 [Candidatus Melainabacteria bacterium]|nr:MAG: hypothetical protein DKT66_14615 [Candidatus Melainabacteria bacterium]